MEWFSSCAMIHTTGHCVTPPARCVTNAACPLRFAQYPAPSAQPAPPGKQRPQRTPSALERARQWLSSEPTHAPVALATAEASGSIVIVG